MKTWQLLLIGWVAGLLTRILVGILVDRRSDRRFRKLVVEPLRRERGTR